MNPERISKEMLRIGRLLYPESKSIEHPKVRSECPDERPCPYISCRYHIGYDVSSVGGLTSYFDCEPWEIVHSCALDYAAASKLAGGMTLDEIGEVIGMTRERVRQIIDDALRKLSKIVDLKDLKMEFLNA